METVRLQTTVGPDGKVRIEIPGIFPPGPAEVVVVIAPARSAGRPFHWRDFYGFAKDLWRGEDAQQYVNRLRNEWER